MLVLFDQGTPLPLRRYLRHHTVKTASQQGWATLSNGELIAAAEVEGFDVFITTDKNLKYQQNLAGRHISIVVIDCAQWPRLEPHVTLVVAAVDRAVAGTYHEVEIPSVSR